MELRMTDITRRKLLIERMNVLESDGMACNGCPGTCCTFEANSMLVTPLEAMEIWEYLEQENLWSEDLKQKLLQTIQIYRLEPKPLKGRSYLRKTYTCPFFSNKELGCPFPRTVKPYGCLAFNSHHSTLKTAEHCYSEKGLLEERELLHKEEDKINAALRMKHGIYWEKSPLPNALLELAAIFANQRES